MAKLLELRVGPPRDALDRFEAAWNRIAEGGKLAPLRVLTLEDLPLLVQVLSPARWTLIQNLKSQGPASIYELARRLERDYKNVHTDVTRLAALGLLRKDVRGRMEVGWDAVRAELRL